MNNHEILENLLEIAHQPFLIFAYQVEEKTDNAFETLKILVAEDDVTANHQKIRRGWDGHAGKISNGFPSDFGQDY